MSKILLDCDGVLADFCKGALDHVNDLHPERKDHTHADITHWEIERLLPQDKHGDFFARMGEPGFCSGLPLLGRPGTVIDLRAAGHTIEIVTQPPPWNARHWRNERVQWIYRYFGHLAITFTNDKTTAHGDIFVDDRPSHVRAWQDTHRDGTALLFDAPYNRGCGIEVNRIWTLNDIWCYL